MRNIYFVFDKNKNVVPASGMREWARCVESKDRIIELTKIGNIAVSTVFIGLDYGRTYSDKPLVFETMIFNGPAHGVQKRTATWDQAVQIHQKILQFHVLDFTNPVPYIVWEIKQFLKSFKSYDKASFI